LAWSGLVHESERPLVVWLKRLAWPAAAPPAPAARLCAALREQEAPELRRPSGPSFGRGRLACGRARGKALPGDRQESRTLASASGGSNLDLVAKRFRLLTLTGLAHGRLDQGPGLRRLAGATAATCTARTRAAAWTSATDLVGECMLRCLACCRRRRTTSAQRLVVVLRWTAIWRHLRRLRRLQRYFGYLGHHLQAYPRTLRERLRGVP
jgi:hypothetical protein